MRYRNDTALDVFVHLDPPVKLAPGDEVEHDVHIIGLTRIDEDPAVETQPEDTPAPPKSPAAAKPSKSGKEPVQ